MGKPLPRVDASGIQQYREELLSAWARPDQIFSLLDNSAMLAKPIIWRHPFIFYVGHLPAFSWNQICAAIFDWRSYNPYFDDLFCRGVDPDVDTASAIGIRTCRRNGRPWERPFVIETASGQRYWTRYRRSRSILARIS